TAVAGAVSRHDGEIDKIVGDGMMAFFEGEDADERAVAAAVESIASCGSLVRHPGIGLYRGEVIAAALGAGKRADFTILGRTVNLAARLCALSGEDEITMSQEMAARQRPDLEEVSRDVVRPRHHSRDMSVVRFQLAEAVGEVPSF
uniref:adenylate/guanylate cyclase domain-containing protein n=1 Tax=Aurantimonas marina TaxID=2780508 RepID=UPI0019CF73B0